MTGGHAAALDAHGGLWLWGGNGCGQLGLGSSLEFVDTPTQPPFLCAPSLDLPQPVKAAEDPMWVGILRRQRRARSTRRMP